MYIVYQLAEDEPACDLPEKDRAAIAQFSETYADLIGRVRNAALETEGVCHFGGIDHYHQQESYWLCKMLLMADTTHREAIGDYSAMMRDHIALCKLDRSAFFLSFIEFHRPIAVAEALAQGNIDDALWQAELDALTTCRNRQDFVDEWLYVAQDCNLWFENTLAEIMQDHPGDPVAPMLAIGYSYGMTPLRNYHQTWFNNVMNELLPLTALPLPELEFKLERIKEEYDIRRIRDLPFVQRNLGTFAASVLAYDELVLRAYSEAEVDLTRFAILLDRYRREHGVFPDTLDVFSEALGGELPANPILGNAYGYLHNDETYRLWYEYIARPEGTIPERRAVVWPSKRETLGPAE